MSEDAKVEIDIDFNYKSVIVSKKEESVFDFINSLPIKLKEHVLKLLQENKDMITFIPFKMDKSTFVCIYKELNEDNPLGDFTLYVFEEKQDMLNLLERKPLNMKSLKGAKSNVIQDIKNAILNL